MCFEALKPCSKRLPKCRKPSIYAALRRVSQMAEPVNLWVQKRCIRKNRGFPRFFSFLLRFPRVFENRFFVKLKRCKCGFCLCDKDLNLGIPFLRAELRDFFSRFCLFFVFSIVNFLCLKKEMITKAILHSRPPPPPLSQE